jgi:hypothetical protein
MFFKIIIILFAISYFLPRLIRFGLKMFISNQVNKVQNEYQNQAKTQKEGEIKVEFDKSKAKSEHLKGGEYVDYEEIKD